MLLVIGGTRMPSNRRTDQAPAGVLSLQRSRHQAPTGRASLRLLHGACCRHTLGACSSLSAALGRRVLAAPTRHLQDGVLSLQCSRHEVANEHTGGVCLPPCQAHAGVRLCNGAATKLRLVEQYCGCSTVHGASGHEVRARLCRWHLDGECLPRTDQAPQAFWLCNGAAIKLRLIELACSCSTVCAVQAGSR